MSFCSSCHLCAYSKNVDVFLSGLHWLEKFVCSVHKFRDLNQMWSIKFTDIVPFKFSVLLRFVVFLETSLESVHEKRAQIEVESPEGKKKKKRKPNERRNQPAQKTINPEENGDKIPQGEGLTPPPPGGYSI